MGLPFSFDLLDPLHGFSSLLPKFPRILWRSISLFLKFKGRIQYKFFSMRLPESFSPTSLSRILLVFEQLVTLRSTEPEDLRKWWDKCGHNVVIVFALNLPCSRSWQIVFHGQGRLEKNKRNIVQPSWSTTKDQRITNTLSTKKANRRRRCSCSFSITAVTAGKEGKPSSSQDYKGHRRVYKLTVGIIRLSLVGHEWIKAWPTQRACILSSILCLRVMTN